MTAIARNFEEENVEREVSTKNETIRASLRQNADSDRVRELVARLGQLVGKALANLPDEDKRLKKCR